VGAAARNTQPDSRLTRLSDITEQGEVQPCPQFRALHEVVSYLELAISSRAPFWARRQTRNTLQSWDIGPENIETAQLLVSELVTNAVKYAGSGLPPGHGDLDGAECVSLILRYITRRLTILVSDPDSRPPVLVETNGEAESGRGLVLVQALSKDWNFYLPAAGGKVVYCVLSA
jgi:anti-sigma regulatory factor (Ser/Thr protein kinase)